MTSLNEEADKYEAPKLKNCAELEFINGEWEIYEETEAEFPYKYVIVNGERYKINVSVLSDMKAIRSASPNITKFKVIKKGEGMKTKYTTIPLQ